MLETLRNAFKIKDIRKRIIFTFLMLVVTVKYLQTGLLVRPLMEWAFLMPLLVDHS